jgi:hypothetical protein
MPSTLVETFELLVEAEQLAPRLEAAATAMAQLPELEAERAWLEAARERLATASVTSYGDLLDRALCLPELESVKGERGKLLQAAIADQVDRLQAAITLAGGARSPLLELVFLNLKVPALRKCGRGEVEKFCAEIQRRLASSYAKRVVKGERWHEVTAAMEALGIAIDKWRAVFVEAPLDEQAAAPIHAQLESARRTVELPVRQARLLAQAALLPAAELLDGAGVLTTTAKRRKQDSHPMLEQEPPDPLLPTPEERAELAALQASPHRA